MMYRPREKVWWFAIITRLMIIFLQFIFNLLLPDHDADAFRSPQNPREKRSVFDYTVTLFFEGLVRWDAQYFIHIAKYGYTYENTLAFYPLYPFAIRCIMMVLRIPLFIFNDHSVTVLTAILINFICFVKSAVTLFDLSLEVFKDTRLAYKVAILYCLNPASIFFTAAYSESMFAYFTFKTMLASIQDDPCVFLPLSLSTLVRSNGLINIGFPVYNWLQNMVNTTIPNFSSEYKYYCSIKSMMFNLRHVYISFCQIMTVIILSLVPFCLFQVYSYSKFCTPESNKTDLPSYVVQYAIENNLELPGNGRMLWCDSVIPMAYSYIQEKYWNVGFLRYYQIKQIPNFILAFPILYVMMKFNFKFLKEHKSELTSLSLLKKDDENKKTVKSNYPSKMFPFVIHGLILSWCCIFIVHIQVSTRLISSASPLLYWFCAFNLSYDSKTSDYDDYSNLFSKWKIFLFTQKTYSIKDTLILVYFVGYIVFGTFMYSNFLPWT